MKLKIGCHLSAAGGYEKMGREALFLGASTFAFFTRNPRGARSKETDEKDIGALLKIMGENDFATLVAHAPYTLNPCSADKKVRDFAFFVMEDDLKKMQYLPGNYYNIHPGNHLGQGVQRGTELTAELLNKIIKPEHETTVLLETMAGKGTEIGSRFEHLRDIIERIRQKDKVGVCMDTCHISDAGYDIKNSLDQVIDIFDRTIGLKYLKAMHINDSLNIMGAKKDRHAKLGEGTLGLDTIINVINHPDLKALPFILETPNDLEGYKREIEILKEAYKG